MKKLFQFIFLLIFFISLNISCLIQKSKTEVKKLDDSISDRYMRVMFYNCENLYDYLDDSLVNDQEFLPLGARHWTYQRFYEKLNRIAKVITAVGGWEPPDIVGLCEIENYYVLEKLTRYSALKNAHYQIIHKESPDLRGIEVALLYQKDKFYPLLYRPIEIYYPNEPNRKTRDILYVKGLTNDKDTLNIFVNHWPSRWGGQLESEDNRIFVASVLRKAVDSVFAVNNNANILIMGDLNDYPDNKSLTEVLKAQISFSNLNSRTLYNLSSVLHSKGEGSHKYQGEWGMLDQIIVSGSLLNSENKLFTTIEDSKIFKANFLLEVDEQYTGLKPFRTFLGFQYIGGFSDHLPVYLDLKRKE